jgi:hypothetical protein
VTPAFQLRLEGLPLGLDLGRGLVGQGQLQGDGAIHLLGGGLKQPQGLVAALAGAVLDQELLQGGLEGRHLRLLQPRRRHRPAQPRLERSQGVDAGTGG